MGRKNEQDGVDLQDITHYSHEEEAFKVNLHSDEALKVLADDLRPISVEDERAVLKKIDWRLVPVMMLVNSVQLVDKNTLSAAATYGLIKQANLKGQEYSLLVALFYIGYLVAEYPSNFLMQKLPTGKYLTVNFILWGVCRACLFRGRHQLTGLALCRFLLGVFEAPLNPGLVVITSSWWRTREQARRIGLWYSSAGFINILVVMIFYGIAHIDAGGMFPYQWMFLIFGCFTAITGIALFWVLPDSPMTCRFPNDRERMIAIRRIQDNQTGIKNKEHKRYQVIEALTDPKVWILTFGVFFQNMTNALQSSFTGLIIKGMGFSTYHAVLLTMPASAVIGFTCLFVTWFLSSRYGQNRRIIAMICCYIPGIIGTVLLYTVRLEKQSVGVLLFAVYFVNTISTCASIMYSLLASNIAGYTKKSVVNSMFFIFYSLGNIVSPQAFLSSQAPRYQTGIAVTLASFCANIVLFSSLYVIYVVSNKRRDKEAAGKPPMDEGDKLLLAFADQTDLENKSMRYAL